MLFRKLFKVLRAVFITLMALILAVNVYLLATKLILKRDLLKLFGFAQIIVVSGSMQPAIGVGDMLIVKEQSSYQVSDIITYHSNQNLITHRVVDVKNDVLTTRGDANNVADDPVPLSAVEGKVVFLIPGAGNLILFLKSPLGILLMLALLFLMIEIPFWVERHKQKEN
jgi:signal peptidase